MQKKIKKIFIHFFITKNYNFSSGNGNDCYIFSKKNFFKYLS